MGDQITTGLVPKETDPKNWLTRYKKFSSQSGLGDSSPSFSNMAQNPVPELNVQPGPQRGSTSISITPNAFSVWNDSVERASIADAGGPVTGAKPARMMSVNLVGIPWWVLIAGAVLFYLSKESK